MLKKWALRLKAYTSLFLALLMVFSTITPIFSMPQDQIDPNAAIADGGLKVTTSLTTDNNTSAHLDVFGLQLESGQAYTFSFWIRGSGGGNGMQAVVWKGADWDHGFYTYQPVTISSDEWTKYELKFTAGDDCGSQATPSVRFVNGPAELYFYGMSLVKDSDGTQLITDGCSGFTQSGTDNGFTFVDVTAGDLNTLFPIEPTEPIEPIDPNTAITDGGWKLESTAADAFCSLFKSIQVQTGESYTFSCWIRGTSSNMQMVAWKENVPDENYGFTYSQADPDEWKKFELKFTADADEPVKFNIRFIQGISELYFYDISIVRDSDGEQLLPGGHSDFQGDAGGFTFTDLTADDLNALFPIEPTEPTEPSEPIDPNAAITDDGWKLESTTEDAFCSLFKSIQVQTGESYTFSCWIRGTSSNMQMIAWKENVSGENYGFAYAQANPDEWKKLEIKFTADSDEPVKFNIRFIQGISELYFYDLSIIRDRDGEQLLPGGHADFQGDAGGFTFTDLTAGELSKMFLPCSSSDPNEAITKGGLKLVSSDGSSECSIDVKGIDVNAGESYTFSFWVRGYHADAQAVVWKGSQPSGDFYGWNLPRADTDVWKQYKIQFTATSDEKVTCNVRFIKGVSELYFYDLSLERDSDGKQFIPGGYLDFERSGTGFTYTELTASQLKSTFAYKSVTNITGVPCLAPIGEMTLNGVVWPSAATRSDIVWSVKDAGTTNAVITDNVLNTSAEGTVVVTATIIDGINESTDYIKDFSIVVKNVTQTIPALINVPYMMQPGDVCSVSGGYFGPLDKINVAILPLTGLTGALSPDNPATRIVKPFNTDESLVQFEIPGNLPKDEYAIWVGNDFGWSDAEYVNKAQPYWVSERTVYPGQKLALGGRNFVNPTNRSADGAKVEFYPVGGGNPLAGKITDVTDYTVQFRAPEDLAAGQSYEIRYRNGAGGSYGAAEMTDVARETVTAVEKNANIDYFDNNFDANVAWLSTVKTDFIVNVKDNGAQGNGTTNDTSAFNTAIAAINANGGGILYVPEGTYVFDGITLGNNTALVGAGKDKTLLKWSGNKSGDRQDLVHATGLVAGVFNLKIESDIRRPIMPVGEGDAGGSYLMYGLVTGVLFDSGLGAGAGGGIVKNVDMKLADGQGVDYYSARPAVVEDSNIDVSHISVFCQPSGRVRLRNNTLKNMVRPTIAYWDNIMSGFDMGQSYIENNTLIGDSINRRALDDDRMDDNYRAWGEVLEDATEHRPGDVCGQEMLFIGNSIEGTYGDPASNAGEGFQSQSISPRSFYGYVESAGLDRIATGKLSKARNVVKNYSFITIIGGPGVGQMRKVADVEGDVLIVDKPWTILPTSESIYSVDEYNMARAIWADNDYSAKTNKGSFCLYSKNYDMTIANNNIAGGGGIWLANSIYDSNGTGMDYCFHSYFMTIYNNKINSWANPWFLCEHNTTLGPCSDGGVATYENPDYPVSLIYGTRIVHNTIIGPNDEANGIHGNDLSVEYEVNPDGTWTSTGGTMSKVPEIPQYLNDTSLEYHQQLKPWWAYTTAPGDTLRNTRDEKEQIEDYQKFAMRSGLYISTQAEGDPFPAANGEIVDANSVTNTMYGIHMSDTSWNTVVRNNSFTGNKYDEEGLDASVRTTTGADLSYTRGAPGVEALAAIDKSALSTTTGGGSGNTGGDDGNTTTSPTSTVNGNTTTVSVEVKPALNASTGIASAVVDTAVMADLVNQAAQGQKVVVEIKVAVVDGEKAAELTIPGISFQHLADTAKTELKVNAGIASITFDSKVLDTISGAAAEGDIKISIDKVDKADLPAEVQAKTGDRPVYDFSVNAGSSQISDFKGGKAEVSIPYTPTPNEKKNSIVVYYIDDTGKLQTVRGKYDEAAGTVRFTVSHFSRYALGYNEVRFTDVAATAWYDEPVGFISARGIVSGAGGRFAPENNVNRADFLIMVMKSYGIELDSAITDNFADAGNKYYTGYLATAKRLGLVSGVGGNKFAPEAAISRQDMFVILYHALEKLGELPAGTNGKSFDSFTDTGSIAGYAKTAMKLFAETGTITGDGSKLVPGSFSTRAQAAQVLYNLLSK